MQKMVEHGYVGGLMAGNALATHDLEGALFHTALGQDIYTQKSHPNGHYNHLDVINKVRRSGSIPQFIEDYKIDNGIIYSCVKHDIPMVLTGSIRDDGPLPEVIGDAYEGQTAMRSLVKKSNYCHMSGDNASYNRRRKYDAVLPGNGRWNHTSGFSVYGGCG